MLKKYQILFLAITAGMLLFAQSASALTIENIRFGLHPDKTRIVLDLDESTAYRTFILSDPWRMVIDLPSFDWHVNELAAPTASPVSDLRKGAFDKTTSRIVIDLKSPARIKAAFFLPAANGNSNRLVIDLVTTTISDALAQKSKIYGTLPATSTATQTKSVTPAPRPQTQQTVAKALPTAPKKAVQNSAAVDQGHLPQRKPQAIANYKKPTIILDAGHGGADPGAISHSGIKEKNVTLAVAKQLKKQLESSGMYNVVLTRSSDYYLRLYERVDFARKHEADLFISLHADSIGKSAVHGASVYTLSEKASDAQTEKLAMRENRADLIAGIDLSAEDEVVVNILVDLAMRDTMNQSKFMANTLVDNFEGRKIKMLQNPHRFAGFAVLKAPDVPSILIEMGFLSNDSEARMLQDASFQKKLASALAASINAYFTKVRENGRS